ncbi:hypothetical protein PVAP13_1KG540900 [Panicum virgatum]|uniref:Cytidyltransferase-like domain-containing protein n=1 Tax=Panicum virgatum TaxID=38727 RepID=A0A8T0Y537_PANVG|nr:hypothetical protein PVAP13_1KG540900 [Panicum virgatum]
MEEVGVEVPLPRDKLSIELRRVGGTRGGVVLVSTGSFNPPTYMHLRMFELAKDELQQRGYYVLGGYMSPVNDAYKKKDLLPAAHRIRFCELACKSSSFVMVDPWEAMQKGYQRTLTVLSRIRNSLCRDGLADQGSLKVMLLCGSDLLESFSTPGVWIPDQDNIISVDEIVPNQISSSRVRYQFYRQRLHKKMPVDKVSYLR